MSAKKDARLLQRYTGSRYMTCLRWAKVLRAEGLIRAEQCADRDSGVRVAFHKRFPDIEIVRDRDG